MTRAADSSIAIAALLSDHEHHERADDALSGCTATIAHVATETYSVLTRLPSPRRMEAASAASILDTRLPGPRLTLDADGHTHALQRLATARVSGGATYDGLIALTAIEHELELVTRDGRAERTYRALGVRFELLR